jgi:putative tryptophan/tyrosine transport system substrate-binding protein
MRRREFLTLLGGAAAWPPAALAQQVNPLRRVAALWDFQKGDPHGKVIAAAFEQALGEHGWSEGRNVRFEYRWAADDAALVHAYAAELASQRLDAILCVSAPITRALKQATTTIPIVFFSGADPVRSGIVASLAKPGGNITGFSANEPSIAGKWVGLILEIVPSATHLGVLTNPAGAGGLSAYIPVAIEAAQGSKVELTTVEASADAQVERAIEGLARLPVDGLLVLPGASTIVHRRAIVAATAHYRLPAIHPFRQFAEDGGLVSYGVDEIDLVRRAAGYVDRILRGQKPADLPVQEPTKFDLVINLRTAKALGITVPPALLASADEVIE